MKLARRLKLAEQVIRGTMLQNFKQQQQLMAWVTEWIGGSSYSHIIAPINVTSGGTTTSAAGNVANLAGITGQILVIAGHTLASSASSAVQLLSNTTNSNSGGTNYTPINATNVSTTTFAVHSAGNSNFIDVAEINTESFPAQYLYATDTIGGTVTSCSFYVLIFGAKKIV